MADDQDKMIADLHEDFAKLQSILRDHLGKADNLKETVTLLLEYMVASKRESILRMEEHSRKLRQALSQ